MFYIVWQFFEPLLFGLIGAAMDLRFISSSLVGKRELIQYLNLLML